jgi:hypothetical protein
MFSMYLFPLGFLICSRAGTDNRWPTVDRESGLSGTSPESFPNFPNKIFHTTHVGPHDNVHVAKLVHLNSAHIHRMNYRPPSDMQPEYCCRQKSGQNYFMHKMQKCKNG